MVQPHANSGMPGDFEGHVLHGYFDRLLSAPHLRDTFRVTFDGTLSACVAGFPRRLEASALAAWLRPGDVVVELARTPAREPFELGLVLHTESAVRLVDRLLGGPGDSAIPASAGAPNEAECGVLAYAAARLVAAHGGDFVVRDVRVDLARSLADLGTLVYWPVALHCSFGRFDGALVLSPACAATLDRSHQLELLVRDRIDPSALVDLAVDDVLIGDRWALTDTIEGLTGHVTIAIEGSETRLIGELARHAVRATDTAPSIDTSVAELVLARIPARFDELARLGGGDALPVPPLGTHPVLLRVAGRAIAEGQLVMHRGELGIRVRTCFDPDQR